MNSIASTLEAKGYRVSTPALPWAQGRIYDASFEDSMREIDQEVESMRQKGAKRVVVAGHSLGANAALGYAASKDGASGIIALAPAHTPELPGFAKRVGLRAHILLCMLAYYVEWHMREAWRALLFADED